MATGCGFFVLKPGERELLALMACGSLSCEQPCLFRLICLVSLRFPCLHPRPNHQAPFSEAPCPTSVQDLHTFVSGSHLHWFIRRVLNMDSDCRADGLFISHLSLQRKLSCTLLGSFFFFVAIGMLNVFGEKISILTVFYRV